MKMTTRPLTAHCLFEDNTLYTFNEPVLNIYPDDCTAFTNILRKQCPVLNTAFHIKGRRNVTLDFNGATLLLHGAIQPFLLEHSQNITIRNVKVLYERPAFTEMTVLEIGDNVMRVRLNQHHTCRVEDGKLIPYSEQWENLNLDRTSMFLQAFDPETRDGVGSALYIIGKDVKPDLPPVFHTEQFIAEDAGDGTILFHGIVAPCFKVGQILVLGHEKRDYSSVMMIGCQNVHIESYHILNGSGMGILPIYTKDIYLDKVLFTPDKQSQGIITNQADGVHAFACSGDFSITNSIFENMIDDALNIHSQFYLLEAFSGNEMTLVHKLLGETSYCTIFGVGDVIGIHHANTTEIEARYTIVALEIPDPQHIKITLDRPVQKHELQSLVENMSAQPDITIRNCEFQHTNTHLRFQSSGKIRIENCKIKLPVLLTGDASFWYESSGITDLEFRNVEFSRNALHKGEPSIFATPQVFPTEKEPYYHKNIRFVNCTFESETPIIASLTDNIVFENVRNTNGGQMKLDLTNCGQVTAPGCILDRKSQKIESLTLN